MARSFGFPSRAGRAHRSSDKRFGRPRLPAARAHASCRHRRIAAAAPALLAALLAPDVAPAAVERHTGTFNGIEISYRVLLPDDFDPAREYPVVLHFAGGPQTWDIVERSTDADWRAHVETRGLIVVSPAAPRAGLYFEGGDRIFPAFLDHVLSAYPAAGGKLHVAGHSNGGLSAFHVAARHPEYFVSVTGYPGLLRRLDDRGVEALSSLCLYMHVGSRDTSWRSAMEQQFETLAERGLDIEYVVEPDQAHRLDTTRDELALRLYRELEDARAGCGE